MSNYGRYLSISAGGSTWGVDGVGDSANTSLRARFQIKLFSDNLTLNTATVKITNPLPATAQRFVSTPDQVITIDAGYQDNHGVIFKGYIRQAIYGRENPTDTLLTLFCADSDISHNFGTINKTLAPGSTPQDHVNEAVKAMAAVSKGQPFSLGFVDPALNLSQPTYPKSVQLYGMARDILSRVARSKKAETSYQQGVVQIVGYKNNIPGGVVILNTTSGLIGMPTQEIGGIMARALINPNIKIKTQVQIAQGLINPGQLPLGPDGTLAPLTMPSTAADGVYTVLGIIYDGDTRANPWYMDLTCISPATLSGASGAGILPNSLTSANAGG